jgi:phenylacetate-CoA ligase
MTDVYGTLYRKALLPAWEGVVRRRPTLDIHAKLLRSEWHSLDELRAFQERELRRLVRHAALYVPHYRDAFQRLGIGPEDVQRLDQLALLPLLTRSEAQASRERRKTTEPPLPEISKSTSGSTGEPLLFGYDLGSEHWRNAVRLRGYGWAGWRPGSPTLHFWGSLDSLYDKDWNKKAKVAVDRFLRRELFVDSNARSEQDLARVVGLIRSFHPQAMVSFAQAAAELARYVNRTNARSWNDLIVICGAERLFSHDRAQLEQAFGPHIFETYGSREFMLIAGECEAHSGMHVAMENLIVELLVEEDGQWRAARPGEPGQVVITDLHNYGMPFIRYLNGDIAVAAEPGRCGCGRALERLSRIDGRTNDAVRDAEGRSIDALFFNVMFSVMGGKVRQFQVVQRRDGSVSLRIVPEADFDAALLATIEHNCAKFLRGVRVEIQLVDAIPVEKNGKLRVVVVER